MRRDMPTTEFKHHRASPTPRAPARARPVLGRGEGSRLTSRAARATDGLAEDERGAAPWSTSSPSPVARRRRRPSPCALTLTLSSSRAGLRPMATADGDARAQAGRRLSGGRTAVRAGAAHTPAPRRRPGVSPLSQEERLRGAPFLLRAWQVKALRRLDPRLRVPRCRARRRPGPWLAKQQKRRRAAARRWWLRWRRRRRRAPTCRWRRQADRAAQCAAAAKEGDVAEGPPEEGAAARERRRRPAADLAKGFGACTDAATHEGEAARERRSLAAEGGGRRRRRLRGGGREGGGRGGGGRDGGGSAAAGGIAAPPSAQDGMAPMVIRETTWPEDEEGMQRRQRLRHPRRGRGEEVHSAAGAREAQEPARLSGRGCFGRCRSRYLGR